MFRIVQLEDGSSAIIDRLSNKQISVIKAKNPPSAVTGAPIETSSDVGADANASVNENGGVTPPPITRAITKGSKTVPSPTLLSSNEKKSDSRPSSTSSVERRSLRARNSATNYNEEIMARTNVVTLANGLTSVTTTTSHSTSNSPMSSDKHSNRPKEPHHLVVVHRSTANQESSSLPMPHRTRLLPQETLNKLRKNCEQTKRKIDQSSREPEGNEIEQDDFAKYLNLIPSKKFRTEYRAVLESSWPLRLHTRTRPRRRYNHKTCLEMDSEETIMNGSAQSIRLIASSDASTTDSLQNEENVPSIEKFVASIKTQVPGVTHIPQKGALIIRAANGVLALSPAPLNVPITNAPPFALMQPPQPLPPGGIDTNNADQAKNLARYVQKYTAKVEFCSPLGRWLPTVYPFVLLPEEKKHRLIKKHHDLFTRSGLRHEWIEQRPSNDFTFMSLVPGVLRTRPTRSYNMASVTVSTVANVGAQYSHSYTFTRQERMEKFLTLDTGLDWRGRLITSHCKTMTIPVSKIKKCSCCRSSVCTKKGHMCGRDIKSNENAAHNNSIDSDSDRQDKNPPPPPLMHGPRASLLASPAKRPHQPDNSRNDKHHQREHMRVVFDNKRSASITNSPSNRESRALNAVPMRNLPATITKSSVTKSTPFVNNGNSCPLVSSTTPNLPPSSRSVVRTGLHLQVVSTTGHHASVRRRSVEEDVILIGKQGQVTPAPPMLYRSLSQSQAATNNRSQSSSGLNIALSQTHTQLLNINSLRQNVNDKLKTANDPRQAGSNSVGSNGRKGYFDKTSQIMIEEI